MKLSVTINHTKGDEFRLAEHQKLEKLNPKELLLYAAAQCAGKTLCAILDKERIKDCNIEITMAGNIDTEKVEGRSVFTSFDIAYNVECGSIADQPKVSHAINLTTERYCGTLNMLRNIATVSHQASIVSTQEVYQL